MESSDKKLKYRELQAMAKKMHLPGNLKHHLLLELVAARKQGNEDNVQRILEEQKIERAERRMEKLDAREAAYRHLQIPQERRPAGRRRKLLPQESEEIKHKSVPDNYLRSLLAMPHSIQQLLHQSKVPSSSSTPSDIPRDPRLQRTIYCNQVVPENYNQINYSMDQQNAQETYQPHFMAGCSTKDITNYTNRDYNNSRVVNMDVNGQYNNNANEYGKGFDGMNHNGYVDTWNKSPESRRSFQMRDILANNTSNMMTQYYTPYPGDGYSGGNGTAVGGTVGGGGGGGGVSDYPSQYMNDVNGQFRSMYSPSHNYWGMWDEPAPNSQELYWRHFANPISGYQVSANRGFYFEQAAASPNSDTLSAPEQEFDSLFGTSQDYAFSDFRTNNQLSLPLIYNYVASTEGQVYQESATQELGVATLQDGRSSVLPIAAANTQIELQSTVLTDEYATDRGVSHIEVLTEEWTASIQTQESWPGYVQSITSSHSYMKVK